ncbi:MAG: D-alanyl-D-alanine carboxypeptidase family protein [Thermoactinomyces sp.]
MNCFRFQKIIVAVVCFCLSVSLIMPLSAFAERNGSPDVKARSYFLMDFESGVPLAEKNADQPLPPASMTKMMSAFIVLDHIHNGKLNWNDIVRISQRTQSVDETQIYLVAGEEITVRELFLAMLVYSANDATVALAEHIAGTEENFVQLMNEKARQLGMKNTHYCTATGLDLHLYSDPPKVPGKHVMSARDTAILAASLIRSYPEVLQVTSISKYTFHQGTSREQQVNNWNLMLPGLHYEYAGVDGMKTGHTNAAGYCFTGTVKREKTRLISVVMGTKNDNGRFSETKKLFDYGYEFIPVPLTAKDGTIKGQENLPLPNGVERSVPVVARKEVIVPILQGKQGRYTLKIEFASNLRAPLARGTVVGKAFLFYDGVKVEGFQPVDVVTAQAIEEGSWLRLIFRSAGDEIASWFD